MPSDAGPFPTRRVDRRKLFHPAISLSSLGAPGGWLTVAVMRNARLESPRNLFRGVKPPPPRYHYLPLKDANAVVLANCLITHFAVSALRSALTDEESAGRCAHCGYDLRATPDRCPECGIVPAGPAIPPEP